MDEHSLTFSLLLGIFSSLVATAIFIFLSEVFRKIAIPWFADKIYRGIRIDGHWENENGTAQFDLKQWGNKITGKYTHGTFTDMTSYKVIGTLKNMYLMAITEPESDRIIDAGALLLHIEYSKNTLIMQGSLLYMSKEEKIGSWDGMIFKQKIS